MSQKASVLLLCVLVAAEATVHISGHISGPLVREADAQAAATPTSQVAVGTVQGPASEPWVYIYDVASQRLACYTVHGQGIDLRGVRQLTWDLKLTELIPVQGKHFTVKEAKEMVEKK